MRRLAVALVCGLLAVACGPKRPVLYPNAAYRELGEAAAGEVVDDCLERARSDGIADGRAEKVAEGAARGAIFGAVLWGAVGWIFGNPGRGAAAGAAHGGGVGGARGAASAGEDDPVFRRYVEICLRERGLQPIGWK